MIHVEQKPDMSKKRRSFAPLGATSMSQELFVIRGVHHYPVSDETFQETVELLYGEDLSSQEQKEAEQQVREHFAALYVLEVSGDALSEDFSWSEVTQENAEIARDNWQTPYDERPVGLDGKRWAFFFHFLRLDKPLLTPFGPMQLPALTPLPDHLKDISYEAP